MSGNTDGPSAQCSSCGATVHGPPGAMKCPYCGMRVDVPMSAAQRSEPYLPEETEEERRRARQHDRYEDASESIPRESSSNFGVAIGGVVAATVVIIIIVSVAVGHKKKPSAVTDRAQRKTTPTSAATPTKPTYVNSIPVTSCKCVFGDGQSTPQITLTPLASPAQDPSRPISLQIDSHSGFVSSMSSAVLALPPGTALTPLDGGDLPTHMGVACDTGFYVLVVGGMATGWSSVNAKWRWNTTLPATMVDGADAAAPPALRGTDFGGYCTQLTVQNGAASIALAGGKHATLSIKDGKLR